MSAKEIARGRARARTIAKAILNRYHANEDRNYHTENLLLLAESLGTSEEIAYAKKRVEAINYDPPARSLEEYKAMVKAKGFPERNLMLERKINDHYYTLREKAQ